VGFGSAQITRDGEFFYDGEADYHDGKEPMSIGHIESIAKKDPEHDWRAEFYGPLHGETYQRQGDGLWVMIESNMGFA
jgi:hypothetical protein